MDDTATAHVTIDQAQAEPGTRAADGGHVPGACNTLGEFIRSLEDGQFDADCYGQMQELAAQMTEHAWHNGGKAKGKVSITIEFVQEGTLTEIRAQFKVTPPEGRRQKSVMWLTENNRFTRTKPNQGQLFGIRDVSAARHPGFRDA